MNATLVESSHKREQGKLEILLKLLVTLQFHRIALIQVGENSREWCGFSPLCKSSIGSIFPGKNVLLWAAF